ncbi:MAG TPA: GIY-YIG nuclease family protein [Gemmatimonadales bacterium]
MATRTSSTVTLQGRSGAKYQFEAFDWGTEFKPRGAVYAVLRLDPDEYAVLYIGQTGDLSERFDDHHKAGCFASHRKTHIGIHLKAVERERLVIEQDLIAFYYPPCNGS